MTGPEHYRAAEHALEVLTVAVDAIGDDPDKLQRSAPNTAALASLAQAHAVLEVGEQAEYAGEQLRRIADSLDRLVEHLTAVPACEGCEHPGHPGKACATEVPAGDRPPGIYRCGCRWLAG